MLALVSPHVRDNGPLAYGYKHRQGERYQPALPADDRLCTRDCLAPALQFRYRKPDAPFGSTASFTLHGPQIGGIARLDSRDTCNRNITYGNLSVDWGYTWHYDHRPHFNNGIQISCNMAARYQARDRRAPGCTGSVNIILDRGNEHISLVVSLFSGQERQLFADRYHGADPNNGRHHCSARPGYSEEFVTEKAGVAQFGSVDSEFVFHVNRDNLAAIIEDIGLELSPARWRIRKIAVHAELNKRGTATMELAYRGLSVTQLPPG